MKKRHGNNPTKSKCKNRGIHVRHNGRCSMFPLSNQKAEMPKVHALLGF